MHNHFDLNVRGCCCGEWRLQVVQDHRLNEWDENVFNHHYIFQHLTFSKHFIFWRFLVIASDNAIGCIIWSPMSRYGLDSQPKRANVSMTNTFLLSENRNHHDEKTSDRDPLNGHSIHGIYSNEQKCFFFFFRCRLNGNAIWFLEVDRLTETHTITCHDILRWRFNATCEIYLFSIPRISHTTAVIWWNAGFSYALKNRKVCNAWAWVRSNLPSNETISLFPLLLLAAR